MYNSKKENGRVLVKLFIASNVYRAILSDRGWSRGCGIGELVSVSEILTLTCGVYLLHGGPHRVLVLLLRHLYVPRLVLSARKTSQHEFLYRKFGFRPEHAPHLQHHENPRIQRMQSLAGCEQPKHYGVVRIFRTSLPFHASMPTSQGFQRRPCISDPILGSEA